MEDWTSRGTEGKRLTKTDGNNVTVTKPRKMKTFCKNYARLLLQLATIFF